MALILMLETSTDVCSAALFNEGQLLCYRENSEGRSHASTLAVFIDEILKEVNISPANLSAVAVSKGPGSYTGLRIGVSTAKGICYAQNLPLIAVDSLLAMTFGAIGALKEREDDIEGMVFCPMIDARRMEVYSALYSSRLAVVESVKATIVDETTFAPILEKSRVVFFGNGAEKCRSVILHANAIFLEDNFSSAKNMVLPSLEAFKSSNFVDSAYFEPFYLKDFVITQSKKKFL
ncbi:MAG TPA: tRNA (adenosine(37)-N6)-threonylcarbamoyltransferase complex dimerization subunit type 1 TsaB [Williamwhitmania sp.]|nr:tRNA (adenosine(37)-N6)-threonylcarbamoyltransferase complex dimerization subunit type 1 TsaB [Williamwhitmania sp.]